MTNHNDRGRPDGNQAASRSVGDELTTSRVLEPWDLSPLADCHVIVVSLPDSKYRRRVFLSLHAAEKAAARARAAGQRAELFLARMRPVGIVGPGGRL